MTHVAGAGAVQRIGTIGTILCRLSHRSHHMAAGWYYCRGLDFVSWVRKSEGKEGWKVAIDGAGIKIRSTLEDQ